MATIFTRIIRGEIPGYKVGEDDKFYAFLDINPVQPGHTLVVPKSEVDYIFDMEDIDLGEMIVFSKKIAKKIKDTTGCKRVAMVTIGLEVPHAHIHLIPINEEADLDFSNKKRLSPEEFATLQKSITL